MPAKVRMDQQGRITVPAECLAAAGLNPGDELLIEVIGEGQLGLRTPQRALREAQAIVARYLPKGRDLVQELIDERRAEAAREEWPIRPRSIRTRVGAGIRSREDHFLVG